MTTDTRKNTEFQRGKQFTEQIAEVAQVPGGLDMLMTVAAEELGVGEEGKSKSLRLYSEGGKVGSDSGGLSQAAEQTRGDGRYGDEMLIHMSPEEFEAITSMWGEPTTNPKTGLPEYFIHKKIWKKIKKTIKKIVKSPMFSFLAPIALNVFAPGLGSAVGGWLGATGKAAATIGNTIVRGGIGAISGGKDGAISGALSGLVASGVGGDIGGKLGLGDKVGKIAGDALLGGAAGEATGVGFRQGALGQGMSSLMGNPMQKMQDKIGDIGRGIFKPGDGEFDVTPGSMTIDPSQQDPFGVGGQTLPQTAVGGADLSDGISAASDPSLWDRATGWVGDNPWLAAGGALAIGSMIGGGRGGGGGAPPTLPDSFTQPLQNLSFNREAMPVQDYYNYGRASAENPGEATFFGGNTISSAVPTPQSPSPAGGGQQPFTVRRPFDLARIPQLVQQGWTYDEGSKTAYPPGSFGNYGSPTGVAPPTVAYRLGGLVQKYAMGGRAHVKGPGTGRSDDIPAVLSDGEYIMDSETVALLGDGSTDAGARRLDEMRKNLRKHKGKKLSKGGFSDDAKTPEQYLAEGGEVKPTSAIKNLKRLANRLKQAVESGNKKRAGEISAQLKSLDGGDRIVAEMAKGGSVRRIIDALERNVETDYRGTVEGKTEKRLRDRRQKERKEDVYKKRRLSDKEYLKLSEELGGFEKNSRFIRNLKKELAKEKEKSSASK